MSLLSPRLTRCITACALIMGTISCATGPKIAKSVPDYSVQGNKTTLERFNDHRNNLDELADKTKQQKADLEKPTTGATVSQTTIPSLSPSARGNNGQSTQGAPAFKVTNVDASLSAMALPEFINQVFGRMLAVPYVTGPGIAGRTDVVQLRSSGVMSAQTFFDLVSMALQDYGVRILAEGDVYQIIEDSALKSRLPRFIRSRASAGTPADLRPVVQFVELNAIRASDMNNILRQAFNPRNENLKIEAANESNHIVLSGLPDDVNSAIEIINQMDELQYAGTQVQRYAPAYWNAETLAQEVVRILNAEGWQASENEFSPKPILLLPISYSNDLLIFSRTPKARARAMHWINSLDRPAKRSDGKQIFVYNVEYLDATILANTVNAALTGINNNANPSGGTSSTSSNNNTSASANTNAGFGNGGSGGNAGGQNFVVDPLGNRLIYTGTASDYDRILPLLEALDEPTPEVLIEVMIAQITLSDNLESGVDWALNNIGAGDIVNLSLPSAGGLTGAASIIGSDGPGSANLGNPISANVNFSAFAENTQVNVLSTPRLIARSGSSAQVQVGSEIPILSAQRTPAGGVGGATNVDVISSVEYRSTGIILSIEPIVFSNNRIDLNISQEISAALPTGGPISSPSFSNTSVNTQLSLEDGATGVIGGLIQDTVSKGRRGIPYLKDVPILGNAFSAKDVNIDRTELVILITAYILKGKDNKAALAQKLSEEINKTLNQDNLITLRPKNYY